METKEYLLNIGRYERVIQHKRDEVERLRELATGATASMHIDGVRTSDYSDKTADYIGNIIEAEKALKNEIVAAIDYRREAEKAIEQLPTAQYDLLYNIYFKGMDFQTAASKMDRSYSWVTMTHAKALKSLQKVLDEKERKEDEHH